MSKQQKTDLVSIRRRLAEKLAANKRRRELAADVKDRRYTQAWATIHKIFIQPIIGLNSGDWWEDFEWLSLIFDVKNRIINNYVVKRNFEMPGGFLLNLNRPSYGVTGEVRKIVKGDMLCVRQDLSNDPDFVDVEVATQGDWEKQTRCFRLSKRQWEEEVKKDTVEK